jgi:hypothetical protein
MRCLDGADDLEFVGCGGRIDSDERWMVSLTAQLLDVEVHDAVAARHAAQAKKGRAGGKLIILA